MTDAKVVKDLEDYIDRLEACVMKAAGLRNEAMIRTGDSPMAARAVDEYDAVRSRVQLRFDRLPAVFSARPTEVQLEDGRKVVVVRDGRDAWLEVVPPPP